MKRAGLSTIEFVVVHAPSGWNSGRWPYAVAMKIARRVRAAGLTGVRVVGQID